MYEGPELKQARENIVLQTDDSYPHSTTQGAFNRRLQTLPRGGNGPIIMVDESSVETFRCR